jgi:hypothetical protein
LSGKLLPKIMAERIGQRCCSSDKTGLTYC